MSHHHHAARLVLPILLAACSSDPSPPGRHAEPDRDAVQAQRETVFAFARKVHAAIEAAAPLAACAPPIDRPVLVTWDQLSELAAAPRPSAIERSPIARPHLRPPALQLRGPSFSQDNANAVKDAVKAIETIAHVAVLRTDRLERPVYGGDVLTPGTVEGRLIVVRIADAAPLCSLAVTATSSKNVGFEYQANSAGDRGYAAGQALEDDLRARYGAAADAALARVRPPATGASPAPAARRAPGR
jgi:hypothetical protein